jgi:hypothetical protein
VKSQTIGYSSKQQIKIFHKISVQANQGDLNLVPNINKHAAPNQNDTLFNPHISNALSFAVEKIDG